MEQAPDAAGFYIHYRPGRLNDQVGTIVNIVDRGDGHYTVETDIEPRSPAAGYAGTTLHVGDTTYEVTGSRATGGDDPSLEVDVVNRRSKPATSVTTAGGTEVDIKRADSRPNATIADVKSALAAPGQGDDCTVSIPPAYKNGEVTVRHGDRTVYGHNTDWTTHLEDQVFTTPDGGEYVVKTVEKADKLRLDRQYEIPDEDEQFRSPRIWELFDGGGASVLPDTAKQGATRRLTYTIEHPVHADYSQPAAWEAPNDPSDWQTTDGTVRYEVGEGAEDPNFADGNPYRQYEVEVPIPGSGDPSTDPFVPDASDPVAYAHFAVSTFDDNGNEGRVSPSVQVARAKSDQPTEPTPPEFDNEIDWATPPDYDGHAHYTVRWQHPGTGVKTHVYRTMDKALFRHDWKRRTDGASQDVTAANQSLFPPYRRGNGDAADRRRQIVSALDDLHATVTDTSDFQTAFGHYRDLAPDVQQVIAALPENRAAYAQQTIEPLDPDTYTNTKGPDFEESDPVGEEWCGWVDEFDGRSRRRYFYRTGTVDSAHNRSDELSYPTQPVQAEDTVPPTAPSPNGIEAGHHDAAVDDDGALTLRWDPSPERDAAAYRVYHTTEEDTTRDVRLMEPVTTVPHPDNGPVEWSDTGRRADVTHYYRITTVDETGNESEPSAVLAGQPFDLAPPEPPTIDTLEWVQVDDDGTIHPDNPAPPSGETWHRAVHLEWSASDSELRSLVEVQTGASSFREASEWLDLGEYSYLHQPEYWEGDLVYRIAVRNRVGTRNEYYETATLSMGGGQ
jgi:hypothetical protein